MEEGGKRAKKRENLLGGEILKGLTVNFMVYKFYLRKEFFRILETASFRQMTSLSWT